MSTAETKSKPTESKSVAKTEQAPARDKSQTLALREPRLPYHPLIEQRFGVDKASWKALVEAIFPNATTVESVILALSYCRARKLDPFKRNVHIVPIWNKDLKAMVDTIWPGIGELRTTAFRTGEYAGLGKTVVGPDITKLWGDLSVTFPEWAQVTVFRMVRGQRVEFCGPQVYWLETYASNRDGSPNQMWADRPRGQLAKCFDSDTEVLTDQGFQPFGFVTGKIMQVTERGLEPTDSVPFSQKYDGQMIVCDGQTLNFSVTPNHDMVTIDGKLDAQSVYDRSTSIAGSVIPLAIGQQASQPDLALTDQQIILGAAIICDGSRHGQQMTIGVSRPKKVKELESLGLHSSSYIRKCAGDKANAGTRVITTKNDKTIFAFKMGADGGVTLPGRDVPDTGTILRMSRRQARVFVDAMIRFDGCTNKTSRRFYSSSPQLLGVFELAACMAGYSISRRRERISDIGGPNWSITVSSKEQAKTYRASPSQAMKRGGLVLRANRDGFVWCCRVPSGVIVVRRNGLSMICGNCAEAAALRAAFPEECGGDYIPEEVQHGRPVTLEQAEGTNLVDPPATRTEALENKLDSMMGATEAPAEQVADEVMASSPQDA